MNGTNALALYRLSRVPEKKETRKRTRNTVISLPTTLTETGIEYFCSSCNKINIVKSTTLIQCTYCDHRILEKSRTAKAITLNAV